MRIIIDAMSKLELKSVVQRYGRQTIVNGVDFRLEQGSIAMPAVLNDPDEILAAMDHAYCLFKVEQGEVCPLEEDNETK